MTDRSVEEIARQIVVRAVEDATQPDRAGASAVTWEQAVVSFMHDGLGLRVWADIAGIEWDVLRGLVLGLVLDACDAKRFTKFTDARQERLATSIRRWLDEQNHEGATSGTAAA